MEPSRIGEISGFFDSSLGTSHENKTHYFPAVVGVVALTVFACYITFRLVEKRNFSAKAVKPKKSPPRVLRPASSSSPVRREPSTPTLVPTPLKISGVEACEAISRELMQFLSPQTQNWLREIKHYFTQTGSSIGLDNLEGVCVSLGMRGSYKPSRPHDPQLDRFTNIMPVEATALKVDGKLFNGNNVHLFRDNRFIATQAPHRLTRQGPEDPKEVLFWRCLMYENVSAVFNLSNAKDGCDSYVSTQLNEPFQRGSGLCDLLLETTPIKGPHRVSTHRVVQEGFGAHTYTYVKVSSWEDGKGISLEELDRLVETQQEIRSKNPNQPILAHCHAGVGRTGVFLIACALKRIAEMKQLNHRNFQPLILALVLSARDQRNPMTVQTSAQFKTIVNYALYLIEKGEPTATRVQ